EQLLYASLLEKQHQQYRFEERERVALLRGSRETVVGLVAMEDCGLGMLIRDRQPAALREVDERGREGVVRHGAERPDGLTDRRRVVGDLAVVLADVVGLRWFLAPLHEDRTEGDRAEQRNDGACDRARCLLVVLARLLVGQLLLQVEPSLICFVGQRILDVEDPLLERFTRRRRREVERGFE